MPSSGVTIDIDCIDLQSIVTPDDGMIIFAVVPSSRVTIATDDGTISQNDITMYGVVIFLTYVNHGVQLQ
jgi:hypothetical protein